MKEKIRALLRYFTWQEYALWGASMLLIIGSFLILDRAGFMTLAASLTGSTAIIFNAKGNPFGQLLMVIFSVMYAVISCSCAYYGEMITYVGMTAPMALFSLISWLKNPYNGRKSEVAVNSVSVREIAFMSLLSVIVTVIFWFILDFFGTANMLPSTLSVTTSFIAAYLTFRRSPYFSLAYAANDVVLLVLWALASIEDSSYISVLVCFVAFLANDIYGFISWQRIKERQSEDIEL